MEAYDNPNTGVCSEKWVANCLEQLDAVASPAGHGIWHLSNPEDDKTRTTVSLDSGWITVERKPPGCQVTRLASTMEPVWRFLDPRSSLSPGFRAVLPAGGTELRIRTEIPLGLKPGDAPALLARWIDEVVHANSWHALDLENAATGLCAGFPKAPFETAEADISELCAQAGWSTRVRNTPGEVAVALPTRDGGICHAMAVSEDGVVRLHVDLGILGNEEGTPACQAAVAVALLLTAGAVRLLRSTATRSDGYVTAGLEVCLPHPVGIEMLNYALSTLAFAHQQLVFELDAMASDQALASAYLSMQGVR